jgi:hypothetical protein
MTKGFSEVPMLEVSHMFSLYKESASLQRQLRDIKDSLDSGK